MNGAMSKTAQARYGVDDDDDDDDDDDEPFQSFLFPLPQRDPEVQC